MPTLRLSSRPGLRRARSRRGMALMLVLLLVGAIGALAIAGIYLADNATMMARARDRERELRYAADNSLAMAKSRLNTFPAILPDTGFDTLFLRRPLQNAYGATLPMLQTSAYLGPVGDPTGQTGLLDGAIVVEARLPNGAGFVRALEVRQESFAKYAYWSNRETMNGNPIYFMNDDQVFGPVWSNDVIRIHNTRATFHGEVGTASTINGANYGSFRKGRKENQRRIELPTNSRLAKLQGYAAIAGFAFNAPNTGSEQQVAMRIEFVAKDLNADGDSTDANEGLFRVFTSARDGTPNTLRGDWLGGITANTLCGDWHMIGGERRFFPAAVHRRTWMRDLLASPLGGMTFNQARDHTVGPNLPANPLFHDIMNAPGARCFPAGDPHLAPVERADAAGNPAYGYTAASAFVGGTDTTFTPSGRYGSWSLASNSPDVSIVNGFRGHVAARYHYAAFRGLTPGARGIIFVNGTVALSGVLRGRITLYAQNGNVVVIDDLRYAKDPSVINPDPRLQCTEADILGIIAGRNIVLADNALNTPQNPGAGHRVMDDTKDLYVHAVLMALNTSMYGEHYDGGPMSAS
ncbi:MAG TPA: hypothetical protein VEA99_05565, partial [Gemmatimonadaceae bacterium]|nr:hypothetical protein [Gemmatimonadaceae bacterium]